MILLFSFSNLIFFTALLFVRADRARTIIIVMVIVTIMRRDMNVGETYVKQVLVIDYTFDWLYDLSQVNEERHIVQHLSRNIVTSNF